MCGDKNMNHNEPDTNLQSDNLLLHAIECDCQECIVKWEKVTVRQIELSLKIMTNSG